MIGCDAAAALNDGAGACTAFCFLLLLFLLLCFCVLTSAPRADVVWAQMEMHVHASGVWRKSEVSQVSDHKSLLSSSAVMILSL